MKPYSESLSPNMLVIFLAATVVNVGKGTHPIHRHHVPRHGLHNYTYGPPGGDFSYVPEKRATTTTEIVQVDPITAIYLNYDEQPGFHHWMHYGKAYYENIEHLYKRKEGKVKMIEIGVQSGGSSRVWKQVFKEKLDYVGVDVNPMCSQFERLEDGIKIEIGNQLDVNFLKKICARYGPFDFIVDDGGHTTEMIVTTMSVLWYCLEDKGVYAVEDLHTHAMWSPQAVPAMMVQGHGLVDHIGQVLGRMESYYKDMDAEVVKTSSEKAEIVLEPDMFAKHIEKAVKYDSLLFLHYREQFQRAEVFKKGRVFKPP